MYKKTLFYLLFFLFSLGLSAQDSYRYTFFDMSQVALNPALAGGFEGTARFGGIIREQDYGLVSGQYRSPLMYLDAPLIRGFRKQDWIGFGFSFQRDQSPFNYEFTNIDGVSSTTNNGLVTTTTIGGLSYHFAFDKKRKNVLAIGFQTANSSNYFEGQYLSTPEAIKKYFLDTKNNTPYDSYSNLQNKDQKKSNNLGYTIGAVFTSKLSKTDNYKVGLSVANIGKRNSYSIIEKGRGQYRTKMKFVMFGQYKTELANGLIIEPRAYFRYMSPSWEGSVQSLVGLKLKKPSEMVVYAGLGYNPINGAQILFAADVKNIKVIYSFDLNFSDKTTVSGVAGAAMELGISYILKIQKRPNPDPVLVCPNL